MPDQRFRAGCWLHTGRRPHEQWIAQPSSKLAQANADRWLTLAKKLGRAGNAARAVEQVKQLQLARVEQFWRRSGWLGSHCEMQYTHYAYCMYRVPSAP